MYSRGYIFGTPISENQLSELLIPSNMDELEKRIQDVHKALSEGLSFFDDHIVVRKVFGGILPCDVLEESSKNKSIP
jgi:hypothetical protein